jgi:hypothetical protein
VALIYYEDPENLEDPGEIAKHTESESSCESWPVVADRLRGLGSQFQQGRP